jgi:dTDP-4-dehydrorhamnose 3,5-epimerase
MSSLMSAKPHHSFVRWIGLELSREKWNQLFVPTGFADGFVTLMH